MSLRAIIIEDEAKARRVLEELLKTYCPDVELLEAVSNVPEGVKAIQKHQPDLVFLDIEMPQYNGFQLFDFIEEVNFEVIFTTAYQEYAIQAFEVSAIAYLLKPIQIEKMVQAVEKVAEKKQRQSKERLQVMKTNLHQEKISKLAFPVAEGYLFLETNEIMYLTAEGAYTMVFLRNNKKVLVSKSIKNLEEMLDFSPFLRVHRSFIINLNAVKQYVKQDGGYIVMENEESISLSKEKKADFLLAYQSLS